MKKMIAFVLAALLTLTVMAAAEIPGMETLPDRSLSGADRLAEAMNEIHIERGITPGSGDDNGLQPCERVRGQIESMNQPSTNPQDGIRAVTAAEGALGEITQILEHMRETAVRAADTEDEAYMEIQKQKVEAEIRKEIGHIDEETEIENPDDEPTAEENLFPEPRFENEHEVKVQTGIDMAEQIARNSILDRNNVNTDLMQEAKDRLAEKVD